jgi:hypothetical protein
MTFTAGSSRATVASPATKAALTTLMEAWPCSLAVDDLCESALSRAGRFASGPPIEDIRRAMMDDLLGAVMHGLIELHTERPPCTNRPSETPRAHPVAAFQAARGDIVVNAHHGMRQIDPLAREVLKLANGRCSRGEMAATLGVSPDSVEDAIATLTKNALLVA